MYVPYHVPYHRLCTSLTTVPYHCHLRWSLPARQLHLESYFDDFSLHCFAVITLNDDGRIFDAAAAAAALFEKAGYMVKVGGYRQAINDSDDFAAASGGFAADTHGAIGWKWDRLIGWFKRWLLFASTLGSGLTALAANPASFSGVYKSAVFHKISKLTGNIGLSLFRLSG